MMYDKCIIIACTDRVQVVFYYVIIYSGAMHIPLFYESSKINMHKCTGNGDKYDQSQE